MGFGILALLRGVDFEEDANRLYLRLTYAAVHVRPRPKSAHACGIICVRCCNMHICDIWVVSLSEVCLKFAIWHNNMTINASA